MYRDPIQWSEIRNLLHKKGHSIRQVVRDTGLSRGTVRKISRQAYPPPYGPRVATYPRIGPHLSSIKRLVSENETLPPSARKTVREIYDILAAEEGYTGGYTSVKDSVRRFSKSSGCIWGYAYDLIHSLDRKQAVDFLYMLSRADPPIIDSKRAERFFQQSDRIAPPPPPKPSKRVLEREEASQWLNSVTNKSLSQSNLRQTFSQVRDIEQVISGLSDRRLSHRKRSIIVLAQAKGLKATFVRNFLNVSKQTHLKYLKCFANGGALELYSRKRSAVRKVDNEFLKREIFSLMHQPPSNFGINRTTWIMKDFTRILRQIGHAACPQVVRAITKAAGFRWLKAKTVLTSNDPDYSEKLSRIQTTLAALSSDQLFFSIDEFGPLAIKLQPGRKLTAPGEMNVVPQFQKSRGSLIITAALELKTNQITHFYSEHKNTDEMIKMMVALTEQHTDCSKIFLSWDAASWHMSKKLETAIFENNGCVGLCGGPLVETAPLPAGAQFLNVIEAVFSGMARAIIHNSDYATVDDAKAAIDRYFRERNAGFLLHPHRAGGKIWGREPEVAAFSESNNCKDPAYR